MSGADPKGASNWRAWLRKAESDWLNVDNNLGARAVPWDTVCFHCGRILATLPAVRR